jgi:hypothetical protein
MKTSRSFVLATAALVVGFFAARWCFAQRAPPEPPVSDFGSGQQLTSFLSHLQESQQTNTLKKFNDYELASFAARYHRDLDETLAILQRFRDGHTNEAYELLEGRLNTDIIAFVIRYRLLPVSARDWRGLKILREARDYRAKFPSKHRYPSFDEREAADALKILDE